ncbi:MAG: HD domain-containing protein [Bacteroidota bacterium]|nr:HD domain-containing protein [Bacteroidota bacterium]
MNKRKIFNDPIYGFITIPTPLIFDLIEHPYFQRLRRIKQLGITDLVYMGANHTRFHHALGAMHLMQTALESLRHKGYEISDKEYESALIAILLHDIGHGPFSHVLESSIFNKVHHESISLMFMQQLNTEFNGELSLAIEMFKGTYERHFFSQLVSSQLDVDRMDYLNRDAYFSGVIEGTIGSERILNMLEIRNDEIVIQEKGIYSIENFLNSRRLMYWQVYLHKTTIAAEEMLIQIIKRAKLLAQKDVPLESTKNFRMFFENDFTIDDFKTNPDILRAFGSIDDLDLWSSIKNWQFHSDWVLSFLCTRLLNRKLFKIIMSKDDFSIEYLSNVDNKICNSFSISTDFLPYLRIRGELSNYGYIASDKKINILKKTGELVDIAYASDLPNIKAISEIVKKYYICSPPEAFEGLFNNKIR